MSCTDPSQTRLNTRSPLLDSSGRIVTPSSSITAAQNAELPRDTLILTKSHHNNNIQEEEGRESDIAAQKGFLKAHSKPGEKIGAKMNAEELLRAMEKRKMMVGPGIERGGCTLVNEKRREGWVGNAGVRRVVPGDY